MCDELENPTVSISVNGALDELYSQSNTIVAGDGLTFSGNTLVASDNQLSLDESYLEDFMGRYLRSDTIMVGSSSSLFKGTEADLEFKEVLQGLTLEDAMVFMYAHTAFMMGHERGTEMLNEVFTKLAKAKQDEGK